MPRYIVERNFAGGLSIPIDAAGAAGVAEIIAGNAREGVTWLRSFVNDTRTKTFCVYDAPDARALDCAAAANRLPVDRVTPVSVLDPYFYF